MSIDLESESLITLAEACRLVPPDGVSPATMARWIQRGVRGVVLATVVIGARRLTSKEALSSFFAAQNAPATPAPGITVSQRRRQSEAARQQLKTMGGGGEVSRANARPTKDFSATTGVAKR